MKTVCCSNMPLVNEAFSTLGETLLKDGREICAADVKDADILATRSTTKVNADLLEGSSVKFVGTATIGTDHIDTEYLASRGITWTNAAGCNANSVSEYFCAAILRLAAKKGFSLKGKTVGVVGVGNVGSLVAKKARALGMNTVLNDPPRQQAEAEGREQTDDEFVCLDELLEQADIVTLHVPLTKEGDHPTYHMAGAEFLHKLKDSCIFINASRGAAVDTDELVSAISSSQIAHTVIDTWEHEPDIRSDILDIVDIATPHIAGHSFEGKVMGTVMVYRDACRFLGKPSDWDYESLLPEPVVPKVSVNCAGRTDEDVLNEIVSAVYDIDEDDRNLREISGDMAKHFDSLRKNYRMRREFRFTKVSAHDAPPALPAKIKALDFRSADVSQKG